MKRILLILTLILFNTTLLSYASMENEPHPRSKLEYRNMQYGFSFSLPESWRGFKIVNDKWEGLALKGSQGEESVELGPMILIRHPGWTSEKPRQDIPIMIFTPSQWKMLQEERFHIGAAPIGPTEIARSSRYVFALPARYNYSFLEGLEEVEDILEGRPLNTINH